MSRTSRSRRQRSVTELLASIALGFELVVVFLAALVLFGLRDLPPVVALGGGGAIVLLLIVTIGFLRYRWALWLGSAVQLLLVTAGVVNPVMYFVGGVFAALWIYCLVTGTRIDRMKKESA